MKPHEEIWHYWSYEGDSPTHHASFCAEGSAASIDGHECAGVTNGSSEGHAKARARLASCAPEAIRMLLEEEWDYVGRCPWCKECSCCDGHADDCKWLALMKKAGVR